MQQGASEASSPVCNFYNYLAWSDIMLPSQVLAGHHQQLDGILCVNSVAAFGGTALQILVYSTGLLSWQRKPAINTDSW